MNTETLFQQAELAQAAYALDLVLDNFNIMSKLTDKACGMTPTQV
jgi:hypothetical protein